jgi:RNA polymerase sigma factor (TIGR02999 family)
MDGRLRANRTRGVPIDRKPDAEGGEITRLVERWSAGDEDALKRLIELVYDDLHQIAHRHLRLEGPDHTINTTALVHEAYLRLVQQQDGVWRSRGHFFAFASRAMRNILIDYARRRRAQKRGGTRIRIPLDENVGAVEAEAAELLALDEVLEKLAKRNPRMARVVECRFFGGLTVAETAQALGASVRTVEREWTRAHAYLYAALSRDITVDEPRPGPAEAEGG